MREGCVGLGVMEWSSWGGVRVCGQEWCPMTLMHLYTIITFSTHIKALLSLGLHSKTPIPLFTYNGTVVIQ